MATWEEDEYLCLHVSIMPYAENLVERITRVLMMMIMMMMIHLNLLACMWLLCCICYPYTFFYFKALFALPQ